MDGLLIASARPNHPLLETLSRNPVPHVFLNRAVKDSGRNVTMDVARSSVTALDHLHALGHRVIGHIMRPLGNHPQRGPPGRVPSARRRTGTRRGTGRLRRLHRGGRRRCRPRTPHPGRGPTAGHRAVHQLAGPGHRGDAGHPRARPAHPRGHLPGRQRRPSGSRLPDPTADDGRDAAARTGHGGGRCPGRGDPGEAAGGCGGADRAEVGVAGVYGGAGGRRVCWVCWVCWVELTRRTRRTRICEYVCLTLLDPYDPYDPHNPHNPHNP